jgi:shikimate dehydrogenase
MHQAAYRALDLAYRYVAIDVEPGQVGAALEHLADLGYRGVNVTVPHKEEALHWAHDVEPFARRVRAANTVDLVKRSCINTDAPGFLETIASGPGKALILGAGGSSRPICLAMFENGWDIHIYNRTRSKACDMIQDLNIEAKILDGHVVAGCDLIVNTTSASLKGESLAIDWSGIAVDATAYDLMYGDGPTPFLIDAKRRGLRTIDGRTLLVAQGALAFEWWTGLAAPREAMMRALT